MQDGWDDDDDIDLSLADTSHVKNTTTTAAEANAAEVVVNDGWDDFTEFSDSQGDADADKVGAFTVETKVKAPKDAVGSSSISGDESNEQRQASSIPAIGDTDDADVWGDGLDDLSETMEGDSGTVKPSHQVGTRKINTTSLSNNASVDKNDHITSSKLAQDFGEYLDNIPHLVHSLQALLEAEYSTPEKAMELLQYYYERPNLAQYTVEKEIPRMDYSLQLSHEGTITDKADIVRYLKSLHESENILARCANQSLLADVLQVLTGFDRVIRPQFLASAQATSCSFRLQPETDTVQARAVLDVTLPSESGRWTVAQLEVFIHYVANPDHAFITYQVKVVSVAPKDENWHNSFKNCLMHLQEMDMDGMHSMQDEQVLRSSKNDDFRDVFLQQTQTMWLQSSAGFKSAWKEIDNVAGISSKIKKLPTLLPDIPVEEPEDTDTTTHVGNNNAAPRQRPTSILGGFLRSGISQLAKTVVLPEEDPELYQSWQAKQQSHNREKEQPKNQSGIPKLYNRPEDKQSEMPKLYNRPEEKPASIPKLYNRRDDKQQSEVPKLYNRPEEKPTVVPPPDNGSDERQSEIPKLYNKPDTKKPVVSQLYNKEKQVVAPPSHGKHEHHISHVPKQAVNLQPKAPPPPLFSDSNATKSSQSSGTYSEPSGTINMSSSVQQADRSQPSSKHDARSALCVSDPTSDMSNTTLAPMLAKVKSNVNTTTDTSNAIDTVVVEVEQESEEFIAAAESVRLFLADPPELEGWVYNPANGIIPTRKRWVSPYPGSRQIK